ncbi:hypothetical protein PR048_027120 [Dryococelus australis]|uniref:Uncharacterized protein n=1 Tax=Dryococelus australis TaxID=614101 RepID=A0ABQ9GG46_9NEOP|nr:hypothetical protein PR048_027120 [Dryococelus australis]
MAEVGQTHSNLEFSLSSIAHPINVKVRPHERNRSAVSPLCANLLCGRALCGTHLFFPSRSTASSTPSVLLVQQCHLLINRSAAVAVRTLASRQGSGSGLDHLEFLMWITWRTLPLIARGFLGVLPFNPILHSTLAPYSHQFTLKCAQVLALFSAFEAEERGSDKGATATRFKCAIAAKATATLASKVAVGNLASEVASLVQASHDNGELLSPLARAKAGSSCWMRVGAMNKQTSCVRERERGKEGEATTSLCVKYSGRGPGCKVCHIQAVDRDAVDRDVRFVILRRRVQRRFLTGEIGIGSIASARWSVPPAVFIAETVCPGESKEHGEKRGKGRDTGETTLPPPPGRKCGRRELRGMMLKRGWGYKHQLVFAKLIPYKSVVTSTYNKGAQVRQRNPNNVAKAIKAIEHLKLLTYHRKLLDGWLKKNYGTPKDAAKCKHGRLTVQNPETDQTLVDYCLRMKATFYNLTRPDLRSLGIAIVTEEQHFKLHPELSIRKQTGTSYARREGFNESRVRQFFFYLLDAAYEKHNYPPDRISKVDEIGLAIVQS